MENIKFEELDYTNMPYEEFDRNIRGLTKYPINKSWSDGNTSAFRCSIPKANDRYVEEAVKFSWRNDNKTIDLKHYRSENFFGNMFNTDKPLHGRKYGNTIMWDFSSYDLSCHSDHIELLRKLALAYQFNMNKIHIYSIRKDFSRDTMTRNTSTPFARPHLAIMIVNLQ